MVVGCDDTTSIRKELTKTQMKLIKDIAEDITAASEYGCMPKMGVEPVITNTGDNNE